MKQAFTSIMYLLLCISAIESYAQQRTFTQDFRNLTFPQFAAEIEKNSGYRFFFDPQGIDTLRINAAVVNKPIAEILDQIFRGTSYRYALDANLYIYITTQTILLTELPSYFFAGGNSGSDSSKHVSNARFEEAEKVKVKQLITIGSRGVNSKTTASIAGYIRNGNSGEPVIGAMVQIENPVTGVITDGNGYYSIQLAKGQHTLLIRSLGMKSTERQVLLHGDGQLNIELEEDVLPLKEIIVESNRDERVLGLQMGLERIDIKTMKQIPVVMGEVDILRAVLTLPGVQSVGEGTVGFNVRGGATDQNLILFNEATIYNPSHLFGFFSAINPDLLKNVELFKSGVPAEYGGRISSILDITTREGNKKKWAGSGGISPVTGRIALEGPIIKDKSSVLMGGRFTYSDWLLKRIPNSSFEKSEASFYDVNLVVNHEIDSKNNLHVSGYLSNDRFMLQNDTIYKYSNQALSASWRHIFSNKLIAEFGANFSGYDYSIVAENNPVSAFDLTYSIKQFKGMADFNYFHNARHTVNFGVSAIRYNLEPGTLMPSGDQSLVVRDQIPDEHGMESAIYVGDNFEVTPRLSLYGGLRYSHYRNAGPKDVYVYESGSPRDVSSMVDTIRYAAGEKIASYSGPEIRVSARYSLSNRTSVKLSYNRMRQYIQMLSNTTAISPADIWKLSDTYIKPLLGDQISIGYYHNLRAQTIETSVEAYVRTMKNFLDYKGGAELILNHHIETDALNARGRAYGVELMMKKTSGKLNGWLSYAYSRSLLQTKGASDVETINRGEYYPSNYDKPHAFNFIGNYKFNRRLSLSVNVVYSTGRPITFPISKYTSEGIERLIYSDRNQYRIPDYFRTDLSLYLEGNHKVHKPAHGFWSLSLYNLTGRRNAYSVYFTSENGTIKGYKLSIFGSIIPTITYNFKFLAR